MTTHNQLMSDMRDAIRSCVASVTDTEEDTSAAVLASATLDLVRAYEILDSIVKS